MPGLKIGVQLVVIIQTIPSYLGIFSRSQYKDPINHGMSHGALVNHCSDGVCMGCRIVAIFLVRFTEWGLVYLPTFQKKNDPNVGKYDETSPIEHLG